MAKIGGDLVEIQWQNDEIGSGIWSPKASEDSTFNPGGIQTADDDSMVDGAGDGIYTMNNTRWSIQSLISWNFGVPAEDTLFQVSAISRSKVETTFTITHINGSVWVGKGKVVGAIEGNGNNGTIPIKLSGSKGLQKIV